MFTPEVDKDGRRVTAAMAKKFCLGAGAWRPGATQGSWVCGGWRWVLREEQLQQLQLSGGWWPLEHQHNSSLQSVLAAKSKSTLEWAGQTWDGRGGDTLPSQGSLPWCSCFRPRGLCCSCSAWLLLSFRRCSAPDTYSLPLQFWLLASSEGPAGPADPQPNAAAPSLGMAPLAAWLLGVWVSRAGVHGTDTHLHPGCFVSCASIQVNPEGCAQDILHFLLNSGQRHFEDKNCSTGQSLPLIIC